MDKLEQQYARDDLGRTVCARAATAAEKQRVDGHNGSVYRVRALVAHAIDFDLYATPCGRALDAFVSSHTLSKWNDDGAKQLAYRSPSRMSAPARS